MRTTQLLLASTLITLSSVFTGCASIVHSGNRSIPIASKPNGAKVTIYDRDGKQVSTHETPFVASLDPRYGYFKGQTYRLVFELEGYKQTEIKLQSTVSGWYFGNIVFGGLIGMIIVDPLTGSMFNLTPEKIEQSLPSNTAELVREGKAIAVIFKDQATPGELAGMVALNR